MICPFCGATIPDGSEVCRDCGHKLEQPNVEKTEIVAENLSSPDKTSVLFEEPLDKTQIFSEGLEPVGAFLGWLVVIEGPDQWKEFHIPVNMSQLLIGKGDAADIRLNDDSLSRIHVSIRKKDDKFFLTDLDTDTGTKVNGQAVERTELEDGDTIGIGETIIKFKLL
ncbi:MAG: FHA domain-containing protein [Deltaproteobacteria bacterium]|nr:FHA domain-containing protein [Deltaproteobacteria bacterium]